MINKNPLLCYCPNPKCSYIVQLEQESQIKGICSKCKTEICGKCRKYFHKKISCEEAVDK